MLDRRPVKVTNLDVLCEAPTDSSAVDTEVDVLNSPQLAQEVADRLRLDRDPEFARLTQHGSLGPEEMRDRLVRAVQKHLHVSRSGLSQVIDIRFNSGQPEKAAAVANQFARLYLSDQVRDKTSATRQAADWLAAQLRMLRDQVTADETAVQHMLHEG